MAGSPFPASLMTWILCGMLKSLGCSRVPQRLPAGCGLPDRWQLSLLDPCSGVPQGSMACLCHAQEALDTASQELLVSRELLK